MTLYMHSIVFNKACDNFSDFVLNTISYVEVSFVYFFFLVLFYNSILLLQCYNTPVEKKSTFC